MSNYSDLARVLADLGPGHNLFQVPRTFDAPIQAERNALAAALAGLGPRQNSDDARRNFVYSMPQAGMDSSPVQSPWQGAARVAQAMVGGLALNQADTERAAAENKRGDALAKAMAELLLKANRPSQGPLPPGYAIAPE